MALQISPVNMEARRKLDIKPGDTVRVWQKIQEKGKTRLQAFEGLVLSRKHGNEPNGMFTVRRVSSGVGIEKIFPLYSPNIDRIEIVRRSKVRRAKLYYVREKVAREIRRHMRNTVAVGASSTADFEIQEDKGADANAPIEEGGEEQEVGETEKVLEEEEKKDTQNA